MTKRYTFEGRKLTVSNGKGTILEFIKGYVGMRSVCMYTTADKTEQEIIEDCSLYKDGIIKAEEVKEAETVKEEVKAVAEGEEVTYTDVMDLYDQLREKGLNVRKTMKEETLLTVAKENGLNYRKAE